MNQYGKTGEPPITYEEAKRRALDALDTIGKRPSYMAMFIWPNNRMKGQGAAFAASAILNQMEKEGLCKQNLDGWVVP